MSYMSAWTSGLAVGRLLGRAEAFRVAADALVGEARTLVREGHRTEAERLVTMGEALLDQASHALAEVPA